MTEASDASVGCVDSMAKVDEGRAACSWSVVVVGGLGVAAGVGKLLYSMCSAAAAEERARRAGLHWGEERARPFVLAEVVGGRRRRRAKAVGPARREKL